MVDIMQTGDTIQFSKYVDKAEVECDEDKTFYVCYNNWKSSPIKCWTCERALIEAFEEYVILHNSTIIETPEDIKCRDLLLDGECDNILAMLREEDYIKQRDEIYESFLKEMKENDCTLDSDTLMSYFKDRCISAGIPEYLL